MTDGPLGARPGTGPKRVDYEYAARQKDLARGLIEKLIDAPKLMTGKSVRNGFTTIKGRAMFIRHGELFPDQPANGAVLASFQDPAIYYSMADASGVFYIKGAADRKHVENRLILEAYKFNPETGRIVWAVDKPSTGKNAYRLKIKRQYMETELVMFDCRQTTLFNLIEPRSFRYLTKIQILDGRTEATPLKYSYSRIDTLSSVLLSVFLEPGTHMKMTLSDSVLDKKMILLNSSPKHPEGTGVSGGPLARALSHRSAGGPGYVDPFGTQNNQTGKTRHLRRKNPPAQKPGSGRPGQGGKSPDRQKIRTGIGSGHPVLGPGHQGV